ncbi:MAG: response regulator [Campylobacteraceae bacterium]|nr:response regulator [Campylobacteraceae bacterium]
MKKVNFASSKDKEEKTTSYTVLIVDDDASIQEVTSIILEDFKHKDYELNLIYAKSEEETIKIIEKTPDIAVIILDVVMESYDSGFKIVKYIREVLKNKVVRIIIRTGQAGRISEKDAVVEYDINDYADKTNLNSLELFTKVVLAIRTYEELVSLHKEIEELKEVILSLKKQ